MGHEDGHVTGMVAGGGVLLLVGSLVLLVDDDEAEVSIGEEQGGAHTEDDGKGAVGELPLPEFDAFVVGKLGVVDAQLFTEVFAQAVGDLSGEGDFGQEIEHLPSLGEGALDEFGVNLRFSAGRYPFEEHHLVVVPTADNRVVSRLLDFAQGAVEPSGQGFVGLQAAHFDVDALQDAALDEGGEGRCGVVAEASDEVVAAHVGDEVGIV